MPDERSSRRRPRPPQRPDSIPPPASPQPLWPEAGAEPTRPPERAGPAPERREAPAPSDARPLTLKETFTLIRSWYAKLRGTWSEGLLGGAILLVAAALAWAVLSLAIPWAGGIVPTVRGLLALDLPWSALGFGLANAVLLAWRIRVEDRALAGRRGISAA